MATNSLQAAIDISRVPKGGALNPWRFVAASAVLVAVLLSAWLALDQQGGHASVAPAARTANVAHEGLSALPLSAQGPVSAALGADYSAFRVVRSGGSFRAHNSAQQLNVQFRRSGVAVDAGKITLGLTLRSVSHGVALTQLNNVTPRKTGNRVLYEHSGLTEWYSNGPLGLEQGFTISRPPVNEASIPLTLSMALSGGEHASLARDRQSLTLTGTGRSSLRYGGLFSTDATGRVLHSWLELASGMLKLRVDTRRARYPLRIDPMIQQSGKITGTGETGNAQFAASVALSANGNTALDD